MMRTLDPMKDVDGLHPFNAGQLYLGNQTLVPATPVGVMRLLAEYEIPVAGARAVVVGRSALVGQPVAMLLCTRTRRDDLPLAYGGPRPAHARRGHPRRGRRESGPDHRGHGQAGRGRGRRRHHAHRRRASSATSTRAWPRSRRLLTPVPGGVGPMTIACLLGNALRAARYRPACLRSLASELHSAPLYQ